MINEKFMFRNDDFSNRSNVLFFDEEIGYLHEEGHTIDIGCGTGNSQPFFNGVGQSWTGLTFNKIEFECAKSEFPDRHIIYGDAHDIPLGNNIFDNFIFWDSLEHMVSPFIALSEAMRICKPMAKGLIFMPGQNWLEHHDHIHVMTVPQMEQLFRKVGLRCVKSIRKKYPNNPEMYCEGMAVYQVLNDPDYQPEYKL
jgi:ubiquinone/menaquinone biosynthesis C-methylase UbiE